MADCEVEGTIASPLSIPLERAMSPTGERRDERGNIRTRQNPLGPQERQTRIDKALLLWLILSLSEGVLLDPKDHRPLRSPISGGERKNGPPSKVPSSPRCDLEKLAESCTWCKEQKSPASAKGNCQVIYSQFGLAIHQNDHQARRRFVVWAQNEIAVVPDFHNRILFSDEAHFWLNGCVNKQNCCIWSEVNPQVYVETPLHKKKLTVWCALWAGGIIGLYFFKNDDGHNVTVNGDRYRAMITNFFIPELNNHDVQELWFQQDGATCHTARARIDLLKDTFDDRLISRFRPVNWSPRSCDLTPLDYFLWGYVKSLVYADKPQTPDDLEDNIRRVIADIRPQMLGKVIEN
ncbi:putative DD41D transposase [Trichonephila clavipes]|nr:putative DD41D transposase [Trichonephila clavipes]